MTSALMASRVANPAGHLGDKSRVLHPPPKLSALPSIDENLQVGKTNHGNILV
jgi:hypothetical protein